MLEGLLVILCGYNKAMNLDLSEPRILMLFPITASAQVRFFFLTAAQVGIYAIVFVLKK